TGGDGTSDAEGGEVFLQAANVTGPNPFNESTARDSSAPPVTPTPTGSVAPNEVRGVNGGTPGLYGGTRNVAACDVEKQIRFLQEDGVKNRAFGSVVGVEPSGVPAYLRSLTPVQLRLDTRVTNHGFRDGAATPYQAVLQAGTAVLVDDRGAPRVRCACGNPLTPPVAQRTPPEPTGEAWPGYRSSAVVVVTESRRDVDAFVLYDTDRGEWISRPQGDTGAKDKPTEQPKAPVSPAPETPSPASPPSRPQSPGPESPPPEPDSPDAPQSPDSPNSPNPADSPTNPDSPDAPNSPHAPDSPDAPNSPESPDSPGSPPSPQSPASPPG
ncbi:DUF6777 domain-containing protein, partial [Streptomyces chromofuscus]